MERRSRKGLAWPVTSTSWKSLLRGRHDRSVSHRPGRPRRPHAGRSASASTAGPIRASRATRSRRALLANGVLCWGARSNITARAAPLSLGSDEPNALVARRRRQGPRYAEPARDAGRTLRGPEGALAERLAVAAIRRSGGQWRIFRVVSRRLLLQDLHAAAGRVGGDLRALHPPRRGPRRRAERARSRSLRVRAPPLRSRRRRRAARRGSRRRWARRGRERGSSCSTSSPNSAARCWRKRAPRSTGKSAADWVAAAVAELAASPKRRRCCRARRPSAITPANFLAAAAAADRSSAQSRSAAAARAALAGSRQARDPGDRRARAPAGVPRQRPAGHHARRIPRARSPCATACSRGARSSSRPRTTAAIAPRSIWPRPAARSP